TQRARVLRRRDLKLEVEQLGNGVGHHQEGKHPPAYGHRRHTELGDDSPFRRSRRWFARLSALGQHGAPLYQAGRAPGRLARTGGRMPAPPHPFWIMTSVDFTTTLTASPFFRPSSSALLRVITLSMRLSPTLTTTWAMMSPI